MRYRPPSKEDKERLEEFLRAHTLPVAKRQEVSPVVPESRGVEIVVIDKRGCSFNPGKNTEQLDRIERERKS
jgi:hypothetical protein